MPTDHIISLLIAERDKLNAAIEALQGSTKHLGRPPKSAAPDAIAPVAEDAAPKKRKAFSAATKRKMAAAQKARWAAIKGEK
jgi:hypothetical protein